MLRGLLLSALLVFPVSAPAQEGQPARLRWPLAGDRGEARQAAAAHSASALDVVGESIGREVDLGRTALFEEINELRQSVAVLPGGGFATAWTATTLWTQQGLPLREVRLQYVRPSGGVVFPDGGLVLAATTAPELPYLVDNSPVILIAHPTSGVFVAYGRGGRSRPEQIVVQWVDGEGKLRWPGAGTSAFGAVVNPVDFYNPHLVAGGDGGVFVCARPFRL
ncbi:MAG TPA: hypothetical protein VGV61_06305 [Thermoanaerobaculia bacterium]|jgi:hypothetical protein|nr:hypothetical protein [Thermoanaerobaculia bacterium]